MLKWFRRNAETPPAAKSASKPEELSPSEPAQVSPSLKPKGLFTRMRERLERTRSVLVDSVLTAVRLRGKVDEELLDLRHLLAVFGG